MLFYKDKIQLDLEDLSLNPNFEDGIESLKRDSNMFALIALSIGMSPETSSYRSATPALLAEVQKFNEVKSAEEATAVYSALEKAFQSQSSGSPLQWTKVAHLAPIMKKALPSLSTEIKRLSRTEKSFLRGKNSDKIIGASASLAAIALGCRPNVDETLAPNEKELWEQYCQQLLATSLGLNHSAHALKEGTGSFDDFSNAAKALEATCNTTCHEKFGGNTNP